jgi:hypothetical protein
MTHAIATERPLGSVGVSSHWAAQVYQKEHGVKAAVRALGQRLTAKSTVCRILALGSQLPLAACAFAIAVCSRLLLIVLLCDAGWRSIFR